jgi:hypothetical protein
MENDNVVVQNIERTPLDIVNALAECGEEIHQPQGIVSGLDYEYLEKAGLLTNLEQWKTACADYVIADGQA